MTHEVAEPTPDTSAPPSQAPEGFIAMVQDALRHLYDYAHLQRHPLTRLVATQVFASEDRARALRNLVLDTLERLNPGSAISHNDPQWRPYGILIRRYVDGFPTEEVIAELHTSPRQFQRDHRKGVLAVASILWGPWQAGESDNVPVPAQPEGELRQEMQNLGVALRPTNLGVLVEGIMQPLRALAHAHGAMLELRPPRGTLSVLADPTLARQAFLAAFSALTAMGARSLCITWRREKQRVRLYLTNESDTLLDGSATATELVARLADVKEMMRAQGGEMQVVSSEDKPGALSVIREVRLLFRMAKSKHVLLVDDNDRVLQLYTRYLSAEGYTVMATHSASQALETIKRETPAAIVLDVMMRDTDGWQLLQQLRARPELRSKPIIVCTVLNEPELARALGAQHYLKKPVSQQQLLEALRVVLDESNPEVLRPTVP